MKVSTITTPRLTLRQYQESDIAAWQRWDTDPVIQEYLPEHVNKPLSDDEQMIYLHECTTEEDGAYWSIVWNENNTLVGTISLNEINTYHGVAELSIIIGEKEYWGKGIATEAIGALKEHAFNQMGLRRIAAEFEVDNIGLKKALVADGFQEECRALASRIKRGQPIDTLRYYLLRSF